MKPSGEGLRISLSSADETLSLGLLKLVHWYSGELIEEEDVVDVEQDRYNSNDVM